MLASLRAKFLGRDECRCIVVGLDGGGKTTFVHRLKHGKLDDSEIIRARSRHQSASQHTILLPAQCCSPSPDLARAIPASVCAATVGFNVECVEYRKMIFSLWDLGGSRDARAFWRFYYEDTGHHLRGGQQRSANGAPEPSRGGGSAHAARVAAGVTLLLIGRTERRTRQETCRLLTGMSFGTPLLVLANKQDEPRATSTSEITEHLQLFSLSAATVHH